MADAFRTVRRNTLKIAEEIGEEHYGFRATPDTRTIGETLVHIANVCKLPEQIHRVEKLRTLADFDFMSFFLPLIEDEKKARNKAEIIALLTEGGDHFSKWMESLSDEFLAEAVEYPAGMTPPTKTRFEMLLGVKEHEMHHRGQLMLVQRMTGGVPHLTRDMMARFAAMATAAKG
jgi:uncharacterized damage-inducible protein DinB